MNADEFQQDSFPAMGIKRPGLLVLLSGIGTSLMTFVLLFVLNVVAPDVNLMGWYADYVIPIGAFLVGLIAGSGYGIASWLTGAKIGKELMFQVIVLQVICYFVAQYVEFLMIKNLLPANFPISFWQYYDFTTRSFAWENHGQPGNPFGAWGYGIRALEIGGFALGGLIAPAILFSVPYCNRCQTYMRSLDLGLLPSGIVPRKIRKKDAEGQQAYAKELAAALEEGQRHVEELKANVAEGNSQKFFERIHEQAGRKKEIDKQTSRIKVSLEHCKRCGGGRAVAKIVTGHGDKQVSNEIWRADLGSDFVRDVLLYRENSR